MKKILFGLIFLLVVSISQPVFAFGLSGDMMLMDTVETPVDTDLDKRYRGELTLVNVGPFSISSDFQFSGKQQYLSQFFKLFKDDLSDDDIDSQEGFFLNADLTSQLKLEWPLFAGWSALGSAGYKMHGSIYQENGQTEPTNYLYQGLSYSGGLGFNILPGLDVIGRYEVGPNLKQLRDDGQAVWKSWDLGLRYRLPLLLAQAGYRSQVLTVEEQDTKFSGLYVGGGIRF